MTNRIIFWVLLSMFITSCNERKESESEGRLVENSLINKEGRYLSKERNLQLIIKINDAIIEYSLSDTTGKTLFVSGDPKASDVQRWFFMMDTAGNFWFNSSDVGLYRLIKTTDETYELSAYDFDKRREKIPVSIYEELPSSTKKRLKQ